MSYSFVATPAILSERGNMVQEIRARQWDKTPLGKQDDWPTVLKMAVGLILQSPVAMVTLWGDDGIMLFNDAYVVFAGGHHPQLLGRPVREGWSEVADFADEVMQRVMRGDTLSFRQRELTLHRYGHPEQVWLDLDFSPITDLDDVVVGVLGIVVETTEKYQANKILTLDRERFKAMFDQAPGFMALLSGPKHVYEMVNQAYLALVGQRNVLGKTVEVAIPETVEQGFITILDQVYLRYPDFFGHSSLVNFTDWRTYDTLNNIHTGASRRSGKTGPDTRPDAGGRRVAPYHSQRHAGQLGGGSETRYVA